MKNYTEVPGNAVASAQLVEQEMVKLAVSLYKVEAHIERLIKEEVYLKSIRLRAPQVRGGEWLAVVSIEVSGEGKVGFHSADGLTTVLRGTAARLLNGSMKWKDDEYAG